MSRVTTKRRWLISIGCAVCAASILVAFFRAPKPVSRAPITVNVSLDTNGKVRVGNVTFAGTNLSDAAFAAMGALGVKVGVSMPDTSNDPNLETNVIETLKRMGRAGLFPTNAQPNPYE